jgi:pimeloyl-ACP methyl ester carboxylesterase
MKIAKETITVSGLPIHYEVAGEGAPLVLVHGLSESTRIWYRNVPELCRQYRVYLIDLPGFGAMRKAHRHFNLLQSGAWLDSWMQAVGLEEAHLVGHSMGGYVVMALAALQPQKVKRLVLVDSIGIPFNRPVRQLVYPALKSIMRTVPTFWPCIHYDYLRAGPVMVRKAAQQIAELDAASVIAAVHIPTLIIWGENDDLVPLASGRLLHAQINGARLFIIAKANHFCMFERPDEFNNALLAFLQGHEVGVEATTNHVSTPSSSQNRQP